jgi:hypothetical protein
MEDNSTNSFEMSSLSSKNNKLDILRKDLEVNTEEQVIINKKLMILQDTINETANTDPSYALIQTQINMNQIELDEIKIRAEDLKKQLKIIAKQK